MLSKFHNSCNLVAFPSFTILNNFSVFNGSQEAGLLLTFITQYCLVTTFQMKNVFNEKFNTSRSD
jgi:hypothetical protein